MKTSLPCAIGAFAIAAFSAPIASASTNDDALRVSEVAIRIQCEEPVADASTCAIETRATIENPTDAPIDAVLDAATSFPIAYEDAVGSVEAAAKKAAEIGGVVPFTSPKSGLAVSAAPHARLTIVGRGSFPYRMWNEGAIDGIKARHLLLGGEHGARAGWSVTFPLAAMTPWKDHVVHLVVDAPSTMAITSERVPSAPIVDGGRARLVADLVPSDAATVTVERAATNQVVNGGVLLGVASLDGHLAGRAGYEIGYSDWLLVSTTYEGSQHLQQIVPAVEAVTPWVFGIVPSLGLGAGVPVRIHPETRVGARVQADVHFGPIGFVTALDVFPKTAHEGATHGWMVAGEIAF